MRARLVFSPGVHAASAPPAPSRAGCPGRAATASANYRRHRADIVIAALPSGGPMIVSSRPWTATAGDEQVPRPAAAFRRHVQAARMRAPAATTTTSRSWSERERAESANAAGMVMPRTRSVATATAVLRRNSTHWPSGTGASAHQAAPDGASGDLGWPRVQRPDGGINSGNAPVGEFTCRKRAGPCTPPQSHPNPPPQLMSAEQMSLPACLASRHSTPSSTICTTDP